MQTGKQFESPRNVPAESTGDSDKLSPEQVSDKLSPEARQEILEKYVDIFKTEGLKYRNPYDIGSFLKIAKQGWISTEVVRGWEEVDKELQSARDIGRRWQEIKHKTRVQHRNNVFYPEKHLHLLRNFLNGEGSFDDWAKKVGMTSKYGYKTSKDDLSKMYLDELNTGFRVLRSLARDNLLDISPQEKEKLDVMLKKIEELYEIQTDGGRETGIRKRSMNAVTIKDSERKTLSEFIQKNWGPISEAWQRKFFSEIELANKDSYLLLGEDNLVWGPFGFEIAYILSPIVPVVPSHTSSDYPTEAVIDTLRVAPRDIIGIIVNREAMQDEYEYTMVSEFTDMKHNKDYVKFLKEARFKPPHTYKEGLHDTTAPFLYYNKDLFVAFLISKGLSKERSTKLLEIVLKTRLTESGTIEPTPGSDYSVEDVAESEKYAYEYLAENAPIKENETLWTGLTRVAALLKVPIYDTQGSVLWPE